MTYSSTLIKHTICVSLVKILTLQTWILVNYLWKYSTENLTYSYFNKNIRKSKFAYWIDTHSVKVLWRYVLLNTNCHSFLWHFFQMLPTCPNKDWIRTTDGDKDRQNSEITNRHFLVFPESCLYIVHLGLGPLL